MSQPGEPMPVAKVAVQDVESYDIRVKSNKVYAGPFIKSLVHQGWYHQIVGKWIVIPPITW